MAKVDIHTHNIYRNTAIVSKQRPKNIQRSLR